MPKRLTDLLELVWIGSEVLRDVEIVVPVPLHPDRRAERGFNQAELIAEALAKRVGLPVELSGLTRVRAGVRRRIGAGREDRQAQSSGAFAAASRLVADRRLLLVDDVFTTGATLGACAGALRSAGAARVVALTAARVRLGGIG
ncbi:MAG: ComF family protein [Acidobacteria bacterium]|nr:ComF family protein [Acidobacteriota bacterium]